MARSVQVTGDAPFEGAEYDVTAVTGGQKTTFRYEISEFEPPNRLRAIGTASRLTSIDVVEVAAADEGTVVTFDATLIVPFPLTLYRLARGVFEKFGHRSAMGLARALGGTLLPRR